MKFPNLVFFALLAIIAVQIIHYAPLLPERVATHFDLAGEPNGWSSKTLFIVLYLFTVGVMVAVFAGVSALAKHIPDSMVNLPRKDYWLAPERREATFAFISTQMLWMGNVTLMFLSHVFGTVMGANLESPPHLGASTVWALWAYLAFSIVWTVFFIVHFYRRPG